MRELIKDKKIAMRMLSVGEKKMEKKLVHAFTKAFNGAVHSVGLRTPKDVDKVTKKMLEIMKKDVRMVGLAKHVAKGETELDDLFEEFMDRMQVIIKKNAKMEKSLEMLQNQNDSMSIHCKTSIYTFI